MLLSLLLVNIFLSGVYRDEENACGVYRVKHEFVFHVQDDDFNYITEHNISNTVTSTGEYRSVLSLANANFLDTGYYNCFVNGTSVDERENSVFIYVYVRGKLLFSPNTFVFSTSL